MKGRLQLFVLENLTSDVRAIDFIEIVPKNTPPPPQLKLLMEDFGSDLPKNTLYPTPHTPPKLKLLMEDLGTSALNFQRIPPTHSPYPNWNFSWSRLRNFGSGLSKNAPQNWIFSWGSLTETSVLRLTTVSTTDTVSLEMHRF